MTLPPATRRGILGLFAAAAPAVAIAGVTQGAAAQPPADWRTKPVDQWTHEDELAEARHHVTTCRAQLAADPDSSIRFCLPWWEREYERLLAEGR